MKAIDLSRLYTEAYQRGAEEMAKACGATAAEYQRITLGGKWRNTLRVHRIAKSKQFKKQERKQDVVLLPLDKRA